jgi:hypothetical protein
MIDIYEFIKTNCVTPVTKWELGVKWIHDNPIEIHSNSLKEIDNKDIEETRSKKHRLNHCGHSNSKWRQLAVIVSPCAPKDSHN